MITYPEENISSEERVVAEELFKVLLNSTPDEAQKVFEEYRRQVEEILEALEKFKDINMVFRLKYLELGVPIVDVKLWNQTALQQIRKGIIKYDSFHKGKTLYNVLYKETCDKPYLVLYREYPSVDEVKEDFHIGESSLPDD